MRWAGIIPEFTSLLPSEETLRQGEFAFATAAAADGVRWNAAALGARNIADVGRVFGAEDLSALTATLEKVGWSAVSWAADATVDYVAESVGVVPIYGKIFAAAVRIGTAVYRAVVSNGQPPKDYSNAVPGLEYKRALDTDMCRSMLARVKGPIMSIMRPTGYYRWRHVEIADTAQSGWRFALEGADPFVVPGSGEIPLGWRSLNGAGVESMDALTPSLGAVALSVWARFGGTTSAAFSEVPSSKEWARWGSDATREMFTQMISDRIVGAQFNTKTSVWDSACAYLSDYPKRVRDEYLGRYVSTDVQSTNFGLAEYSGQQNARALRVALDAMQGCHELQDRQRELARTSLIGYASALQPGVAQSGVDVASLRAELLASSWVRKAQLDLILDDDFRQEVEARKKQGAMSFSSGVTGLPGADMRPLPFAGETGEVLVFPAPP